MSPSQYRHNKNTFKKIKLWFRYLGIFYDIVLFSEMLISQAKLNFKGSKWYFCDKIKSVERSGKLIALLEFETKFVH